MYTDATGFEHIPQLIICTNLGVITSIKSLDYYFDANSDLTYNLLSGVNAHYVFGSSLTLSNDIFDIDPGVPFSLSTNFAFLTMVSLTYSDLTCDDAPVNSLLTMST